MEKDNLKCGIDNLLNQVERLKFGQMPVIMNQWIGLQRVIVLKKFQKDSNGLPDPSRELEVDLESHDSYGRRTTEQRHELTI